MWGWGRPKRDLPTVNYNESSEEESVEGQEEFQDGLNFDSPLISPRVPIQSRAGSPLNNVVGGPTLADNVDDTLEEVNWRLHDIAQVEEEADELADLLHNASLKTDINQVRSEHVGSNQVSGEPYVGCSQVNKKTLHRSSRGGN